MTLRLLFFVLVVIVLALGGVAAAAAYSTGSVLFFIAEGMVVIVLLFLIFFYRRIMRPLNALANGLDILRAQDWNTSLRHVGQSEVDNIVDTFNHMLVRLKDQRIRYEERSRLVDLLIQAAPVGVVILDFDGSSEVVNDAGHALLDASPGLDTFLHGLARGKTADFITNGGSTLRCSCHSFVDRGITHSFYIVEDITASVSAAERAAYEKIIRIISHEVNNTVAGLGSAFDTVDCMLADISGMDDCRLLMQSCAGRTRSLSTFISRYAEVVKIPAAVLVDTPVGRFVSRSAPFLQSIGAQAGIPVEVSADDDVPAAPVDSALLEQALVNIVKNAVESAASRHDGSGCVTVTATRGADGSAVITVTDNGPGISPDKSRVIFTPFYTDKPMGQGIGLTFARDILSRHNARFILATAPDGLTRFTIVLPHI